MTGEEFAAIPGQIEIGTGRKRSDRAPVPQADPLAGELDWAAFKAWFARHSGIDLSAYKETQMRRRIGQWCERYGLGGYAALVKRVKTDAAFDKAFRGYLTINTTHFYRDAHVFDTLERDVLPGLVSEKGSLRIWSAACSIGAEPYTVAMLLDAMGKRLEGIPPKQHEIVATDIDTDALSTAKVGIYLKEYFRELPSQFASTYCKLRGDKVEVDEEIRRRVQFQHHNLLSSPPPGGLFDLILCRNVLIYFIAAEQDRLIDTLANSLRKGGVLVVGSTEHVRDPSRFGLSRERYCFYRKGD